MSKYTDDMQNTFKDVKAVRNATKSVIKNGGDIALKEFHEANSIKRLKKLIKNHA